ncbi:hypothetical protein [Erwinia rhapontici]|uniref:hypothetical protein n=1 Tax=Erwinia rhapontici TaxID=55212 RepID=UPI00216966FE|nr:hypothetical protein [Erwinia rhapontici]MCS3608498.1 hypothetical protein [Erwinia rhapontici]
MRPQGLRDAKSNPDGSCNYDSVVEQTGIFAGKGGFDVTVGEHTQLNGAVIGSTATADNKMM